MPLVKLGRNDGAPWVFVALLGVVVVGLLLVLIYDPCPEGFVRKCGTAIFGKLIGHACECTPA